MTRKRVKKGRKSILTDCWGLETHIAIPDIPVFIIYDKYKSYWTEERGGSVKAGEDEIKGQKRRTREWNNNKKAEGGVGYEKNSRKDPL